MSSSGLKDDFIRGAVSSISAQASASRVQQSSIALTGFRREQGVRKREGDKSRDGEDEVREELALGCHQLRPAISSKPITV